MSLRICLPNFAVIGRNAPELWRHINFSRWRPQSRKSTSRFRFGDYTDLRRWKCIWIPNVDEISQSTAEIKLLLVSENGGPPYWNSISGFDFHLIFVISVSFYIFYKILSTTLGGVMTSIFKMAADSHIGFYLGNVKPPTKCNCWSKHGSQIWSRSVLILRFLYIGVLAWMPILAHFWWGCPGGTYFTQITSPIVLTPKRTILRYLQWSA